jgi:hypothetical protein
MSSGPEFNQKVEGENFFDLSLESLSSSRKEVAVLSEVLQQAGSWGFEVLVTELDKFKDVLPTSAQTPVTKVRLEIVLDSLIKASRHTPQNLIDSLRENFQLAKDETKIVLKFLGHNFKGVISDVLEDYEDPMIQERIFPEKVDGLTVCAMEVASSAELRDDPVSKRISEVLEQLKIGDRGLLILFEANAIKDVCSTLYRVQVETGSKIFDLVEDDMRRVMDAFKEENSSVVGLARAIDVLRESLKTLYLDEGVEFGLRTFFGHMEDQISGNFIVIGMEFEESATQKERFHYIDDRVGQLKGEDEDEDDGPSESSDEDDGTEEPPPDFRFQYLVVDPSTRWPEVKFVNLSNIETWLD